mgnify:CR=1 FL=1
MQRWKGFLIVLLCAAASVVVFGVYTAWRNELSRQPDRAALPDPTVPEPAPPWRSFPWRLEGGADMQLLPRNAQRSDAPGSTDYAVTYDVLQRRGLFRSPVDIGTVTVTERRLNNGDVFLFTRLTGTGSSPVQLRLVVELEGNRFELTDFARRDKVHEHDPVTGVDPTTYPIGLVNTFHFDDLRWSVMVGRQYVSRELVQRYDDGRESRLRELIAERKVLGVEGDGQQVRLAIPLSAPGGALAEHWLVAAREPLFRDRQVLDAWIDKSIEEYVTTNKWYTADGTFSKLPWSIEPFTRMGYGRHLTNTQEKRVLEQYTETRERYFYDLLINAVAVLYRQRDPATGLWWTEYTSTWLKKRYGIVAPYLDTRHNEAVGKFLAQTGRVLDLAGLEQVDVAYGNFLVQQARKGLVIRTAPDGYLIVDYVVPGQDIKTHASLNHVLGEMNYLIELYRATGKSEYLSIAYAIRRGVEALGDRWIRENGDLWYQVNPDLTFEGTDYVLVTLYDLLVAQRNWQSVEEGPSPMFEQLIRSKVRYLQENGYSLPSDVRRQLQEQGMGDVLVEVSRGT